MSSHSLSTQRTAKQAGSAYLREKILNAAPAELTLMSFDGIIRFLSRAEALAGEQSTTYEAKMLNIAEFNDVIARAQAIVSDLNNALDEHAGNDAEEQEQVRNLVEDLRSQYLFLNQHLSLSHARRNPLMIRQAIDIVGDFREGWAGAMEKLRLEHLENVNA